MININYFQRNTYWTNGEMADLASFNLNHPLLIVLVWLHVNQMYGVFVPPGAAR